MDAHKPVLALFASSQDMEAWSADLLNCPFVVCVVADDFLDTTLNQMVFADIVPSLAMISRALYPESKPQLVGHLREYFPETEIMVLAPDSNYIPSFERFVKDRVQHLVIESSQEKTVDGHQLASLSQVIEDLALKKPWNVGQYVRAGTKIHEFHLSFSGEKEQVIATLEKAIEGDSAELEVLRQKGALLADELLENAFYGAPTNDHGMKMFRKGQKRQILPDERMVFRFAFDGETLAMEMRDGWGSLGADTVLEYLVTNSTGMGAAHDGGGRGLFIVWRFLDDFHVRIEPGRETLIGGHLKKSSQFSPEAIRSFHILTTD